MTNRLSLLMVFLVLATVCLAQEGLTVQNKGKQKWPQQRHRRFTFRHPR